MSSSGPAIHIPGEPDLPPGTSHIIDYELAYNKHPRAPPATLPESVASAYPGYWKAEEAREYGLAAANRTLPDGVERPFSYDAATSTNPRDEVAVTLGTQTDAGEFVAASGSAQAEAVAIEAEMRQDHLCNGIGGLGPR